MALPDLTGRNIQDTYQRVVQKDENGQLFDGTGSLIPLKIDGHDLIVSGALRAQSYIVSESIVNVSSGSTVFGDSADDSHTFNGNITSSGTISASGIIQTAGVISSSASITASGAFFSGNITASNLKVDHTILEFGKGIFTKHSNGTIVDCIVTAGTVQQSFSDSDVMTHYLGETINITSGNNINFKVNVDGVGSKSVTFRDSGGDTRISFGIDSTPTLSFIGAGDISSTTDTISFTGGTNITASGNIRVSGSTDTAVNIDTTGHITASNHIKAVGFTGSLTGNVIGNVIGNLTGQADTVATIAGLAPNTATTQAAQGNITSLGTLTSLTVSGDINANGNIIGDDGTNITNISTIYLDSIEDDATEGDTKLELSGTTLDIDVGGSTLLESQGDRLKFHTSITSSAISSSGKITANSMDTTTMTATRYIGGLRTLSETDQTQAGTNAQGDIFYGGSVGTTAGKIYKLQTNGNLTDADKDEEMSGYSLLCVAIGTNASTDGMLLRGMVKLATDPCPGTTAHLGEPVYLGDDGEATGSIASHASDDYIRIVGHYMSGSGVIYFNPDNTYIKKS